MRRRIVQFQIVEETAKQNCGVYALDDHGQLWWWGHPRSEGESDVSDLDSVKWAPLPPLPESDDARSSDAYQ